MEASLPYAGHPIRQMTSVHRAGAGKGCSKPGSSTTLLGTLEPLVLFPCTRQYSHGFLSYLSFRTKPFPAGVQGCASMSMCGHICMPYITGLCARVYACLWPHLTQGCALCFFQDQDKTRPLSTLANLAIIITDVQDMDPIFINLPYSTNIYEHSPPVCQSWSLVEPRPAWVWQPWLSWQ